LKNVREEMRNVLASVAEGRDHDAQSPKMVGQFRGESSCADQGAQAALGEGDHARCLRPVSA
jgi:hypothetical protein